MSEYTPPPKISKDFLYHYRAVVVGVYDADSIYLNIDLGFRLWLHDELVRIARIDAPEVKGKEKIEGDAAKDFLETRILNEEVIVRTYKDKTGKYGRYITEVVHDNGTVITLEDGSLKGGNISDWLVKNDHAEYKKY